MKKIVSIILACALFMSMSVCLAADAYSTFTITMQIGNPYMTVNSIETEIDPGMGTAPIIVNERTLLPVRSLIETAGGTVAWNEENQQVTLDLNADTMILTIGSSRASLNGEQKTLDSLPVIINERTMLPIRFIAEGFGFEVNWNENEQIITISKNSASALPQEQTEYENMIDVSEQTQQLEDGLSVVRYNGESLFDTFLNEGGAGTDAELVGFLQNNIVGNAGRLNLVSGAFGCSAISVKNESSESLFGRNFDWYSCNALISLHKPQNGYASVSTVNTNFIQNAYRSFRSLPEKIQTIVSLYAPLDGMNEKGLCAAVLYIEDASKINQNTDKPDITTTTAIRLLLDKASNVDEAIELLNQYDMHDSLGMMVHFALSDASGRNVAVEYINNEMIVTESPVVTNFYLADGNKQGIGSAQSHTRFNTLTDLLAENQTMSMTEVKDALNSVSKHHFGDGETTEWSIVYNQEQGIAQYYHRENYDKVYTFKINQ